MKKGKKAEGKGIKDTETPERKRKPASPKKEIGSIAEKLVSKMRDGVFVVDPEGIIVEVNPALCEMTGYSRDELLGQGKPYPFCPVEEASKIELVFQAVKQDKPRDLELTFKRKSGEHFPVLISPSCIRDLHGKILNYFATVKDITELKRVESLLRANEENYRLLVENQTDLFIKIDPEGRFLFVSKTYCDTFGKTPVELLGKNFIPFVHQDDRKATVEAMADLYRPPYACYVEHRLMTRDGWRWFGWSYKAVRYADGGVSAIVGIGRDITERKQIEENLQMTNQMLSTLLAVSRAVTGSRTPEEFSESLVRVLREVLPVDAFYIEAYIPGTKKGTSLGVFDTIDGKFQRVSDVEMPFELGGGPWSKLVFEKKQPIVIHRKPEELEELYKSREPEGVRDKQTQIPLVRFGDKDRPSASLVFVPLIIGEQVIGIMSAQSYSFNAYTEKDVDLLVSVGRQIAPAVENVLLTHQLLKKTAELQESEERFRQVAENAQEWIWEVDAQMLYTYSSPVVEKILGYKPEEIVGKKHAYELLHPEEDREKVKKVSFEIFAKKQPFQNFITRRMHKNGSMVWVSTSGVPIVDKNGSLLGYRGTTTDVTERVKAEEQLKRTHNIYQSAIANAQGVPYLLKYTDYSYEFMGEGCEELLGVPASELTFEKMREIVKEMVVPEPNAPSDPYEYGRMFREGKVKRYRMDLRIKTPTGEEKWLSDCSVQVKDEKTGKVIGSLGILQDITYRKQIEEELRKSRDNLQKLQMQYQAVLRSTPYGLCLLNSDWRIMYANRSMQVLLDPKSTSTTEIIGLSLRGLFASEEEYKDYVRSAIESVRNKGFDVRELILQRVDGTKFWCMLSVVCIDPANIEAGYVASLSDISDLKRAEELSRTFAELGQRLNAVTSQKEAARVIVETAYKLLGWDACFVSRYIPETHSVYTVLNIDTVAGKKTEYPPVSTGKFPSMIEEQIIKEGARLILRDSSEVVSTLIPFGDTSRRSASLMFVPIRKGEKVVGILSIQSYTPYAYTEDDLETLQILADHCGGALERIHAEELLRESELMYRTLFEEALNPIFIVSERGRFIDANNAGLNFLEIRRDELPLHYLWELIPEAKLKQEGQEDFSAFARGTIETEYSVNGRSKTLLLNLVPLSVEEKRIFYAIGQDITDRKRAEEALRNAALQWRTTFDAISDSVCLMTPEGRILRCNKATTEILGKPFNEIVGRTHYELIHKSLSSPQECIVERIRKTLRRETKLLEMNNKYYEASVHPLLDDEGNFLGGVYIMRDVTERMKAQKALKRSHREMQTLARHLEKIREEERTQIAREIHDELGQTLTALKMDVYWLANRLPQEYLLLHKKIETMLQLIDMTIKAVKKISTELRPGLLDDLGLASAIVWQAEEFQRRTGTKCEVEVEPEDITIDRTRATVIFRIFQEALTNVARHAHASEVKVSLKQKQNNLVLTVKDNGIGINKSQISDPQAIGLIGMRERCLSIGGSLSITGKPNKGTTVVVKIPLNWGGADDKNTNSG